MFYVKGNREQGTGNREQKNVLTRKRSAILLSSLIYFDNATARSRGKAVSTKSPITFENWDYSLFQENPGVSISLQIETVLIRTAIEQPNKYGRTQQGSYSTYR